MLDIHEPTPGSDVMRVPIGDYTKSRELVIHKGQEYRIYNVEIWLNGQGPLLSAVRANSEEGWVDVTLYDYGSSDPLRNRDRSPMQFRLFGDVEIVALHPTGEYLLNQQ